MHNTRPCEHLDWPTPLSRHSPTRIDLAQTPSQLAHANITTSQYSRHANITPTTYAYIYATLTSTCVTTILIQQNTSCTIHHPFAPPLAHEYLPREHSHPFKRDSNYSSFACTTRLQIHLPRDFISPTRFRIIHRSSTPRLAHNHPPSLDTHLRHHWLTNVSHENTHIHSNEIQTAHHRSRHGWRTTISHDTLNRSSFNHATTGPQSSSITQTVSHETSHSSPSSPTRPPITHNHLPRDLK